MRWEAAGRWLGRRGAWSKVVPNAEQVHQFTSPDALPAYFRFRRTCQANWDVGNGAYDAVAWAVDKRGVALHGVGVYSDALSHRISYDMEVSATGAVVALFAFSIQILRNDGKDDETWVLLEKSSGTISEHNPQKTVGAGGTAILKLRKPLPIEPNAVYAVRVHLNGNSHKTMYGEGMFQRLAYNILPVSFRGCVLAEAAEQHATHVCSMRTQSERHDDRPRADSISSLLDGDHHRSKSRSGIVDDQNDGPRGSSEPHVHHDPPIARSENQHANGDGRNRDGRKARMQSAGQLRERLRRIAACDGILRNGRF